MEKPFWANVSHVWPKTDGRHLQDSTMHMNSCHGDCGSWPVLDCTKIKDFPYATTVNNC